MQNKKVLKQTKYKLKMDGVNPMKKSKSVPKYVKEDKDFINYMSLPNPLKPPLESDFKCKIGTQPIENLILARANGEKQRAILPDDNRDVNGRIPKRTLRPTSPAQNYDESLISPDTSYNVYVESNPFSGREFQRSETVSSLPNIFQERNSQRYSTTDSRRFLTSGRKSHSFKKSAKVNWSSHDKAIAGTPVSTTTIPKNFYSQQLTTHFGSIHTILSRIDYVFNDDTIVMGPTAEKAATKINAVIRGFLARRRYKNAKQVLGIWKHNAAKMFIIATTNYIRRYDYIKKRSKELLEKHMRDTVYSQFREWKIVMEKARPMKQLKNQKALDHYKNTFNNKMRIFIEKWKEVAIGPHSRKRVKLMNQVRYTEARKRLWDRGVTGRITGDMIRHEMAVDASYQISTNWTKCMLHMSVREWMELSVIPLRANNQIAYKYWGKNMVNKIFYAWNTYINTLDKDHVNHKNNFDMFTKHYNMRKIQRHYRLTTLKKCMKYWFRYSIPRQIAMKKYRKKCNELCIKVFRAYRKQAQVQRKLRMKTIDRWKEAGLHLVLYPFHIWFVYAQRRKEKRRIQGMLINSFTRAKNRRYLAKILEAWHYLALFGREDGCLSRMQVMKALQEQKSYSAAMESALDSYKSAAEKATTELQQKIEELEKATLDLKEQDLKSLKLQFAVHAAEQQIVRLQLIVDSLQKLHPGSVEKVIGKYELVDKTLSELSRKRGINPNMDSKLQEDMNKLNETNSSSSSSSSSSTVTPTKSVPSKSTLQLQRIKEEYNNDSDNETENENNNNNTSLQQMNNNYRNEQSDIDKNVTLENIELFKRADHLLKTKPPNIKPITEEMPRDEVINEYCKLASILKYLFFGKEPESPPPEEPLVKDELHELLLNPPKWNDFVEGLQARFPLKHPMHITRRLMMETKLAADRDENVKKRATSPEPSTIYNWPSDL